MRTCIATPDAPKAIGPYSQAVIAGGFAFLSGQIPLDPATMETTGITVAEQTERVLQNLGAVLAACGTSFDQVVKTTVYLQDMATFAEMNEVYGRYFADNFPARSTIEAAKLPRGVMVEIDAIALTNADPATWVPPY